MTRKRYIKNPNKRCKLILVFPHMYDYQYRMRYIGEHKLNTIDYSFLNTYKMFPYYKMDKLINVYFTKIEKEIYDRDIIVIDYIPKLSKILNDLFFDYYILYPSLELKNYYLNEYFNKTNIIDRIANRGLNNMVDTYINDIENNKFANKIIIEDKVNDILLEQIFELL